MTGGYVLRSLFDYGREDQLCVVNRQVAPLRLPRILLYEFYRQRRSCEIADYPELGDCWGGVGSAGI